MYLVRLMGLDNCLGSHSTQETRMGKGAQSAGFVRLCPCWLPFVGMDLCMLYEYEHEGIEEVYEYELKYKVRNTWTYQRHWRHPPVE